MVKPQKRLDFPSKTAQNVSHSVGTSRVKHAKRFRRMTRRCRRKPSPRRTTMIGGLRVVCETLSNKRGRTSAANFFGILAWILAHILDSVQKHVGLHDNKCVTYLIENFADIVRVVFGPRGGGFRWNARSAFGLQCRWHGFFDYFSENITPHTPDRPSLSRWKRPWLK